MQKTEKEQVVAELTERLRASESLIVADYRGLTNANLQALRREILKHGARFHVVKNTLARRAAEDAGVDALLAMLEGPTAIAFIESDGDPVAVAKALSDSARDTKVLTIRGGVLSGRTIGDAEVESLATLPPVDVLRGQLVGAIIAPLTQLVGLLAAPLRDLVGLIDARIEQLGGADAAVPETEAATPVDAQAEDAAADEATGDEAPAPEEPPVAEAPVAEAGEDSAAAEAQADESVAVPNDPEKTEEE